MKSLGNFPDPFITEINGQPDALRRAAAAVASQRATLGPIVDQGAGRTIVFTGMGSSYDACYPAVAELARAGVAAIHVDAAELLHFREGMLGPHALVIAVSQSGESAEVVRVVERSREARQGAPAIVAVTNGRGNTLADLADHVLDTMAGEEAGPSTMTFAASLAVIGLVGRALGAGTTAGPAIGSLVERHVIQTELAAASIERLLAEPDLPDRLVRWLGERTTLVILGRGPARAAAEMGALTIKEAVGMPVESLQTAQFRHGPLELAGPDLAAVVVGTEPETRALDVGLARELDGAGAATLVITSSAGVPGETPGRLVEGGEAMHVDVGPLDRLLSSAASIVPSQLLAWRLSVLRGRIPGAYRLASKVTTHE
jgi:glutamine---fructose-6-phosphate transaminase (isomerizing)